MRDCCHNAPIIQSGKLIALGVITEGRVAVLADVSAMASTLPGYEASSWFVVMTTAGTPDAIVRKLSAEIDSILKRPTVVDRMKSLGAEPVGGTPERLAALIAAETRKWREVVRASGAKIE